MNPIRIARILGRPNVGGPVRTVLHLTRRLAHVGYETLLLVGTSEDDEGDALRDVKDGPGFSIRRVPSMRRSISFSDFVARRELAGALAEFEPTIVHTHAAKAGALGRRAAFSAKERPLVVHTYHGHSLSGYFPAPIARCFAWIERGLARRTDVLVAVSNRVKDELSRVHGVAPADRIRVIENGIDLTPFPRHEASTVSAARSTLGAAPDAFVIVVPARLVPIKDHAFLFESCTRWPKDSPPLEIHCCGDGPLRRELEERSGLLPKQVRTVFHGFRCDLETTLAGADVVVLPSKNEGMSLALIEAMAAGVAIVATAVGGTPDLIEDRVDGRLVSSGDREGLLATLVELARDPARRAALGRAAEERARMRHSIERVVTEHDELYRALIARAGTRRACSVESPA